MKSLCHALVFISALLGTSLLHAAPGDLDLSFGGGTAKVTTAIGTGGDFGYSVIQQADGKLVVAGSSWNGSNADVAASSRVESHPDILENWFPWYLELVLNPYLLHHIDLLHHIEALQHQQGR